MPTQNVNLTPELDRFVKDEVASGHFNNASEVHRAALSSMAREREERAMRLERLRLEIQKGFDDVDAGRKIAITGKAELDSLLNDCLERAVGRLEAVNAEALK